MKNIINIIKIVIALCFLLFFGFWQSSYALGEDFSIVLTPAHPEPNSVVTAKITSFHFDVDRSTINWIIDGQIINIGVGKKTVQFTMPDLGRSKTLKVSIETDQGIKTSETNTLIGNDLDLLTESSTHTPIVYKGKPLPTIQSNVEVTALPFLYLNGIRISSSKLIYEWFLNYEKNINLSGAGKNSFTFNLRSYKDYVVTVKVSSQNREIFIEKSVIVKPIKPKIIFYEDSPVFGTIFSTALTQDFSMLSTNTNVKAEPYFFSKENAQNLTYNWKLNSQILENENKNILELETSGEKHGNALIDLEVKNPSNILQFVKNSLRVNF